MNKNRAKDAFYFYKLQFEETNKDDSFYGTNDITEAAYESWKVKHHFL